MEDSSIGIAQAVKQGHFKLKASPSKKNRASFLYIRFLNPKSWKIWAETTRNGHATRGLANRTKHPYNTNSSNNQ